TRRARLSLASTPAAFHLGTAISVTLSSQVTPRAELPASALLERDGKTQVWVIDPQHKTVALRDVTLIARRGDSIVVGEGLQPGEQVVTAGVNSLKPEQKVAFDEDAQ
ncbi:MAG TPA: efflux transporter periplasmic adaptor subunit, partial [Pseudomonas sp.]|nr:efflux transporter periplasmic adaptor subunit [Pseudomonas sp.]